MFELPLAVPELLPDCGNVICLPLLLLLSLLDEEDPAVVVVCNCDCGGEDDEDGFEVVVASNGTDGVSQLLPQPLLLLLPAPLLRLASSSSS